ncbi:MAG: Nascent polypeptide-associated complex protein [Candidatus Methanomethylophilaceae archaeon]|nr:Nascent polypeptide-associated complex protein [Candidatus Methanomethylophilaceae archaeon]
MQKAMKQMGIKQSSVDDVVEVVIRTRTNEIVLKGADVVCVEMGGSKTYQITGPETVRPLGSEGSEESAPAVDFASSDVDLVMSQTGCDRAKAIEALTATDGQPAEAILKIMT